MSELMDTATTLSWLSQWIDDSNGHRDREAITWGRLAKVAEETGEVIAAWIGATAQNPRKGTTHTREDVCKELLDVAVTALAAYEHMTGNRGDSIIALFTHIATVRKRALIAPTEATKETTDHA